MEYLKNWAVFYKKQLLFACLIFLIVSIEFRLSVISQTANGTMPR